MSCRGPANHNSVALILPHKAMISFLGGAIGADIHNDRAGIHCRSVTDSAKVLDALKDPVNGYYDPRDVFTTVPRSSVLAALVRGQRRDARHAGLAEGHAHRRHPRVDADVPRRQGGRADRRRPRRRRSRTCSARTWARRWSSRSIRCGRTIRQIENMTTSYTRALAELVPVFFPDLLYRLNERGPAGLPGVRGGDQADRVRARQDVRIGHDGAGRLHGGAGRGTDPAAEAR